MPLNAKGVGICAAAIALLLHAALPAAEIPTPEAEDLLVDIEEGNFLVLGFTAHLVGEQRVGMVVECKKAERALRASLFFGPFPAASPVQTAVRTPDGTVGRFGPVIRGQGLHSPQFTGRQLVARLVELAFSHGALISNGHTSIWNRIPEEENALARARLEACAGGGISQQLLR